MLYAGYCSSEKRCNSSTFMTENGYQTSSKYVRYLIDEDGLNSFTVDRIRHFIHAADAILYEARFLCKVDAIRNNMFLNKTNGGNEFRNSGHSEETKEKLREAWKTRPEASETQKEFLRNLWKFKGPITTETKEKLSQVNKGRKRTEEVKFKMRKPKSLKHRQALSKAAIGRKHSEESKLKIGIASEGRVHSVETKLKMRKPKSETHKKQIQNRRWWNNGIINKFVEVCPIGENWVSGRIMNHR